MSAQIRLAGRADRKPSWQMAAHVTPDGVHVVDRVEVRARQASDLVSMILQLLGIGVVLLIAVYAHATTVGATADIRAATAFLSGILQVLVSILGGTVTLVMPIVVMVELVVRRAFRSAAEGIAAAVVAFALGWAAGELFAQFPAASLTRYLTVTVDGVPEQAVAPLVAALAALLTVVGPRTKRRTVSLAWNLLWVALGVEVITGKATLPSILVTVLLGMAVGSAARFISGVQPERAQGEQLVAGMRRAGIDPVRVVRVVDPGVEADLGPLLSEQVAAQAGDPLSRAMAATTDDRVYAAFGAQGERWDVIVMDSDQQVIGALAAFWQALRFRSVDRRAVVSLRQATERAALLTYSAQAARVRTPALIGIGERGTSMMLVQTHEPGLVALPDLDAAEIPDSSLLALWRGLGRAHAAGLAHRSITADCLLLSSGAQPFSKAWIIGWGDGDVASSDLARRMDNAQLLAVLALKVGVERAVQSAAQVLGPEELGATAPLLQIIALPRATRIEAKAHRDVIDETRAALLDYVPGSDLEPVRLVRFGLRTVVMVTLAALAAFIVVTTLNFDEILAAFQSASPIWIVVCFVLGMSTYVGAALGLIGFAPIKLPVWRTVVLQIAGSVISLVAPGGVGPAALNLRYLVKRRMSRSLAVATVALVQAMLFVTTVVLLVLIALLTGDMGAFSQLPTTAILVAIAVIAAAALLLLIPKVRAWVWLKTGPTLIQIWPRLVWVLGQPRKLLLGLGGNFLITIGYVAAFWASAQAFGVTNVPLTTLAIIYLAGNSVGSLVPTPGGAGTVELALIGGLTAIGGVPGAVATSIVFLFRGLSYWARVPFGFVAMRSLNARNEI